MIFFTSDTHFGHKNIVRLSNRPFKEDKKRGLSEVDVMNEAIVNNWNEVVKPDDVVYHLGDVALGPIDESLALISRLNGTKILVTGNHDRNFRGGKRSASLEPDQWDERYVEVGFDRVFGNLALSGFKDASGADLPPVMLSHFPYNGDSHDGDRYDEFRPTDSGCPIVHGHTHASTVVSYSERGTLQIHAGVDTWKFRPVSYERVAEIIKAVTV